MSYLKRRVEADSGLQIVEVYQQDLDEMSHQIQVLEHQLSEAKAHIDRDLSHNGHSSLSRMFNSAAPSEKRAKEGEQLLDEALNHVNALVTACALTASEAYEDNSGGMSVDIDAYDTMICVANQTPKQSLALHDADLLERMSDKLEDMDGGVNMFSKFLYTESARLRNSVKGGE